MSDDEDADRLYSLSLEEFTPARDALADRLRKAGDATAAKHVKALRKPTTPAWTANQLAHRQAHRVEALLQASERLRSAQQRLLEGGPAADIWEATLAEREIVGGLLNEAERILEGAGYGSTRATLDRVADTLYAASADATGRTLLRRGRIVKEMRRVGFGDLAGFDSRADVPAPRVKGKPKPPVRPLARAAGKRGSAPAPAGRAGPTGRERLEAERVADRAARLADRAEEDAERLERAAKRARDEADASRRRAEAAAKAAAAVSAEAKAARKEATEARKSAGRAAEKLAKLRRA